MHMTRVLLALGAVSTVVGCTSHDDAVVAQHEEALTASTFGYTAVGGSWGIFGSGIKAVDRFTLAESGSVSKLSLYVDGNGGRSGTGAMKGVVYADAGGQPGALLATSNEVSIASGAAAGWRDLVFSSPVSLGAGSYFVGVLVGGTANVIREAYDAQTGIMRYDGDAYADGAANPYGGATTFDNEMSIYATYTPTPKTFGYTTVGASWGIFGSGIKAVDRFVLAEAGDVSKLSIYVDGNGGPTGTGVMKGVVYADAGGQPGALLAASSEISIPSGAAAGWRDLTFGSPLSLASGSYFLGVLVGGSAYVIRETFDTETGVMRYDNDAYSDGAANPYGGATTFNNKMSLYATYVPGGAPPPSPPPPSNGARLLFKSGFEGNVSLGAPYGISSNNAWQDVIGNDTSTGFSFATQVFGSKFSIQLLSGGGVLSDVIQNAIVSMTGHTGATTRALELNLKQKITSASQDQFMLNVTQSPKEFYISEWLLYPADIAARLGNHEYVLGPPEWKSEGDFRIVYLAYPNSDGRQCWVVQWDTNANGSVPLQTFYYEVNCNVPVPQGVWFHVETYSRRGYDTDGRSWLKINGQTVFDHTGTTIGQNAAPINRLFVSGAYANLPVQTHVDDFEIWDRVPY